MADEFSLSDLFAPSLQIGSTILTAGAQLAKGQAGKTIAARRQTADEFEAQQLEAEAQQSRSIGMRTAQDNTLSTEMVNSTALARAAASGAGASDPTVMNVIARTAGAGAYRAAVSMYEGEAQARLDTMKAQALRYEGATGVSDAATAAKFSDIGAGATVMAGAAKGIGMFGKYWSGPTAPGSLTTTMPAASVATGSGRGGSFLDAGTQQIQDAA